MYSRLDILRAIKNKELYIHPFDRSMLKPNAVTLHLDNEIATPRKGLIDPDKDSYSKHYRHAELTGKGHKLKSGDFILARTLEEVALGRKIAMLVEGRSTLARMGVSVTQTAMVIESGHGVPEPRKIVLEISNTGPLTVVLRAGMKIAKGTIFELKTPTDVLYDSTGKYGTRKDKNALTPLKE